MMNELVEVADHVFFIDQDLVVIGLELFCYLIGVLELVEMGVVLEPHRE